MLPTNLNLPVMKVALFVTCLADQFYPRTAIAVVKVLEHLGCTVTFPREQTCCGQPMYNTGYHDDTRALAKRFVRIFEHEDYIVTPSGSCAAMVHDYYLDLLKDDHAYAHAAEHVVHRTHEFINFLINVLKVDLRALGCKWEGKVTYHYSCHLRGVGVPGGGAPVVNLLKQIEGLDYIPLEKSEQCCGFGGTFAMKYPQISGTMVRDKITCLRETAAPTVISNDAGCTMNIAGACRRERLDVGFISLAEVIAEGLGLLEKSDPAQRSVLRD